MGGLIGDAMGARTEGRDFREIAKDFGEISDFEGAGTDDSAIRLILIGAILDGGGHVTADEFAASFLRNKAKYYRLFYIPVRNMFHKVESKLSLPVYAGLGNMHSSSSAMSISPMGIINACNPRQAAMETYDVAGLIHAGDSTFCRDGACAVAAAIAEAMNPRSTVDSVIEASTAYLHRTSSAEMRQCIESTVSMAREAGQYAKFRDDFYAKKLRDVKSDSRETVPCVLSLFHLARGNPVQAVIHAANFGRDADTIGTMVGGLAGAFAGIGAIKPEWLAKVEANYGKKQAVSKDYGIPPVDSPDQRELARSLVAVIAERAAAQKRCLDSLDDLASG